MGIPDPSILSERTRFWLTPRKYSSMAGMTVLLQPNALSKGDHEVYWVALHDVEIESRSNRRMVGWPVFRIVFAFLCALLGKTGPVLCFNSIGFPAKLVIS